MSTSATRALSLAPRGEYSLGGAWGSAEHAAVKTDFSGFAAEDGCRSNEVAETSDDTAVIFFDGRDFGGG